MVRLKKLSADYKTASYLPTCIYMYMGITIDSVPTRIMSLKELVAAANQVTEQSKPLSLACNCMYMYIHVHAHVYWLYMYILHVLYMCFSEFDEITAKQKSS